MYCHNVNDSMSIKLIWRYVNFVPSVPPSRSQERTGVDDNSKKKKKIAICIGCERTLPKELGPGLLRRWQKFSSFDQSYPCTCVSITWSLVHIQTINWRICQATWKRAKITAGATYRIQQFQSSPGLTEKVDQTNKQINQNRSPFLNRTLKYSTNPTKRKRFLPLETRPKSFLLKNLFDWEWIFQRSG